MMMGLKKPTGVYEIFRDFVCEYGPEFRQYDEQDNLTQRFKKSEGIRQIREEFYENGATHLIKYRSFNVVEVYEATVDIPWDRLASHMIGSYKAQVDRTGNHVRFQVDNPMTRESGSRIPGRHGNDKITYDDILENPRIYPGLDMYADKVLKSLLKSRTRAETIDPMGGGNMDMHIVWYEPLDLCLTNPIVPVPAPTP